MSTSYRKRLYDLRREVTLPPYYKDFGGAILRKPYENVKDDIENLEVRDDDVWVASFPKSGTTWTQEMVWLLSNNLDYEGAKRILDERYGFIEMLGLLPPEMAKAFPMPNPITMLNNTPGKRFVKTHLPWSMLPLQIRNGTKKPKMVYVVRNVKDILVSFYHHMNLFEMEHMDINKFFKLFITDNHLYSPYWENVSSYWDQRNLPNLLFLKYEDMKEDLGAVIRKTASFLECPVPEGEAMEKLIHHLSFDQMKDNKAVNFEIAREMVKKYKSGDDVGVFMRKGKVNSYKEELTEDMIGLMDVWCELNAVSTGYPYY